MRWKATSDQDEGGDQSSALRRPHISKSANLGLSVRRRPVYHPSDLPSTSGSDSKPVYKRESSIVPPLPEGTNPFGQIRSSMGRLNLRSDEGISRRRPLRIIHEGTAEEHVEGDSTSSESETDNTTDSASLPETCAPISIRSHITAQLKIPHQDRNGMRIRRPREVGTHGPSSSKDRGTRQKRNTDHNSPTIPKKLENDRTLPEHENKIPYIRQLKKRSVPREPPKFPPRDADWSHNHGTPTKRFVTVHYRPSAN